MDDPEALRLVSRRRIYEHVAAHPGTHLREIARSLDLPLGTALYHLDFLAGRSLLVIRQDGRYKRFFVANSLSRREKDHMTTFRHAVPRRIAQALLDGCPGTQRALWARLGVSRSTLSFHLGQMVAQEILACEDRRPEKTYRLLDVETSRRLLERYAESLEPTPPALPALPFFPAPA